MRSLLGTLFAVSAIFLLAVLLVMGLQGFTNPYAVNYPSANSLELIPRRNPDAASRFSFPGPYLLELERPLAGTSYIGPSANTPGTPYISVVHFNGWINHISYRQNPGPQNISQYPHPTGITGRALPGKMELAIKGFKLWPFQLPSRIVIQAGDKLVITTLHSLVAESSRLEFRPGFVVRMLYQPQNQGLLLQALYWYDGQTWVYYNAQSPEEERAILRSVHFTNLVIRETGSFDLVERVLGG